MSQLRWSLLILGMAFIAALGWWEWRRPRQGRAGGAEPRSPPRAPAAEAAPPRLVREPAAETPRAPREPPLELPEIRASGRLAADELPVLELAGDPRDVPVLSAPDLPRDVGADVADDAAADAVEEEIPLPARQDPPLGELPVLELEAGVVSAPRELRGEELPELPAAPAPLVEWPPDTERRVVALRLVAAQPARFGGRSLRQALAAEGFVLGKFAIFHKPDDEQRAVLSAASLTRPGTFDAQTMDSQHYGGLSLFAVVPGPRPLPETFEELVATARSLNQRLQGVLQDEAGSPLTPARIASLREHLGRETPA
jgi:cell division protein ZipA